MLSTVDVPEALEKQYEQNKTRARDLVAALDGVGEERLLDAGVDLLQFAESGYVYVKGPAYFKFYHTDRLLRMYSEGDIVPAGPRFDGSDAKIITDFAANVICFTVDDIRSRLGDRLRPVRALHTCGKFPRHPTAAVRSGRSHHQRG